MGGNAMKRILFLPLALLVSVWAEWITRWRI